VASIPFTQFFAEKNYRLVIVREKTDDQQPDMFEGEKFNYRCILTSDHEKTEKKLLSSITSVAPAKIFDIAYCMFCLLLNVFVNSSGESVTGRYECDLISVLIILSL